MFKNPFSFNGRIRRSEYGFSLIIYFIGTSIINGLLEGSNYNDDLLWLTIGYIPLVWFLWAQGAKRCHDLGRNGWWQIIPFYVLWLIFADGEKGWNKYGENPKGITNYTPEYTPQSSQPVVAPSTTPKATQGYQGGYSGGHNSAAINVAQSYASQETQTSEYKSGELYR